MIQAHKSLEAASHACTEGGTIILLAECRDGLGRDDFLNWFDSKDSGELAVKLCEKYQVNGQTAWSLLKKAEKYRIQTVSLLESRDLEKMRIRGTAADEIQARLKNAKGGYIIPNGSKLKIVS